MDKLMSLFLGMLIALPICLSLDNGLGRKPPLGFNTWNYFGCNINQDVIMTAADKLLSLGLAEAGYRYLNIDDCWHTRARDSTGQLQADPVKFPSGMAAIADKVHSKGLKFGIYSDAGLLTCAGFPGSRYHEKEDAQLFASWGVDFLKYDNCFALSFDVKERYMDMRDALNKTGRPIFFSMCNWGVAAPWEWGEGVGNSWRTDEDIAPRWDSVLRSLDNGAAGLGKYAGPGGWNDPDMLEIGNGLLTAAQQRSHFALWAVVKAPLLIGANLDLISTTSLSILKAKEVIAINQDDLGVAGDIIWKEGPLEIWAAPLVGNERAVVLFSRHHAGPPASIRVTWAQLGFVPQGQSGFKAAVRDLYAEEDLGVLEDGFEAHVPNYDVAVLRVTPLKPATAIASSSSKVWDSLLPQRVATLLSRAHCAISSLWMQKPRSDASCQQDVNLTEHSMSNSAGNSVPAETTWRPWHDAKAAELQAVMRNAAAVDRLHHWQTRKPGQLGQRRGGSTVEA